MKLVEGIKGMEYTVEDIQLEDAISRRLEALGMTNGTKIFLLNNKKNGSVIFKVRGTRLAIGRRIADSIHIKEEQ